LNYFANRLVYSEYPHRIWAWFVQVECRQNFDKNFYKEGLFRRWHNEEYANHVCPAVSPLLRYCAFREENLVESSDLECWMNSFTVSRSVTC
jgi:hypothetical protein